MTLASLSQRTVRDAIKYGTGIPGLLKKYGCSEEELLSQMRRIYHSHFDDTLRELRAIGKKAKGLSNKSEAADNAATETTEIPKNPETTEIPKSPETTEVDKVDQEAAVAEPLEDATPDTSADATEPDQLQYWRTREAALNSNLASVEKRYAAEFNKHRNSLTRIAKAKDELVALEQKFNEKIGEFRLLVYDDDTILREIKRLGKIKSSTATELAEVQAKIRSLEVTTICAFGDGEISVLDGPAIDLDSTGYENYISSFIAHPSCEFLRIIDIKTLAKIIAIERNAKRNGLNVVAEFEDSEITRAYSELSSSSILDDI